MLVLDSLLGAAAVAQPVAPANVPVGLNCGAEADGRIYVALGAEVFALPNMAPLAKLAAPRPILFEIPSGKPVFAAVSQAAMPIAAPEPTMVEGCRGNPVPRQSIDIDPAATLGVALADASRVKQAGQVTLAVRRFAESYGRSRTPPAPIFISEDDAPAQRRAEMERRYVRTQEAFCTS